MLKTAPARLGAVLIASALAIGLAAAPAQAAPKPKATLSGASSLTVPSAPSLKYKFTRLPSGKKAFQLQVKSPTGGWMKAAKLKKASGTIRAPKLSTLGAYTYRVVALKKNKVIVASKAKTVKAYGTVDLLSICSRAYPSLLDPDLFANPYAHCDNHYPPASGAGTTIVGGAPFGYLNSLTIASTPSSTVVLSSHGQVSSCKSITLQWAAWDQKNNVNTPVATSVYLTQGTATQGGAGQAAQIAQSTFSIESGKPLTISATSQALGADTRWAFNGTAVCYTASGLG